MKLTEKLSRSDLLIARLLAGCLVLGIVGGGVKQWGGLGALPVEEAGVRADAVFVLPGLPPAPFADEPAEEEAGPVNLRIWEIVARQPLPPRKTPLTPPGWKIVGVTSSGKDQSVLLLFDGKRDVEILKVGDTLPGGARIVQIFQDHLRIMLNGQPLNLNLHKQ